MLITNYAYITKVLGRQFGGLTSPMTYLRPEVYRNYYTHDTRDNLTQIERDSFPTGTNPPYSYVFGNKGALLSATTQLYSDSDVTAGIASGINIESDLDGSGTISAANLSLVVSLASSLSGTGTITTANLVGVVSLASSLSGTGSLTAGLSLISFMNSILEGTSDVTAGLRGTLSMSADIYVNQSTATVNELVAGVWNAVASAYNNAGTMGEKLNDAGSASNPWADTNTYGAGTKGELLQDMVDNVWGKTLPSTYVSGEAGHILDQIQTLIEELHRLRGANAAYPATQTTSALTAGDITIAVTGDPETSITFTRQP